MGLLTVCLEDDHPGTFLVCLKHIIDAYGGMSKVAKATGLNRESLYKALARGGNPALRTIRQVVGALGMRITFAKALTEKERKGR